MKMCFAKPYTPEPCAHVPKADCAHKDTGGAWETCPDGKLSPFYHEVDYEPFITLTLVSGHKVKIRPEKISAIRERMEMGAEVLVEGEWIIVQERLEEILK